MKVEDRVDLESLKKAAWPLTGARQDYDPLLERIGDSNFALLGEASHGTHEFYRQRAEITRRLITEKKFTAVAAEADWPDAYRLNRFVRGEPGDSEAVEALSGFKRFPTWMWRNADVLDFLGWLRHHNDLLPPGETRAGFYGLDLYSLSESIAAVLQYLDKVDPEAAQRARYRYSCFDHFGEDVQRYGYAAEFGLSPSCEKEVVEQLVELRQKAGERFLREGLPDDELFFAEQNARVIRNAEQYYRVMFRNHVSSWNLRDRHMTETLEALFKHLKRRDGHAKLVVWAHNSHLGDARATELGHRGEWNVGQLARERYGRDAVLVGFTTYTGTVTAASNWNGPAEQKRVRPALPESWEALFHKLAIPDFLLTVTDGTSPAAIKIPEPLLERAIGVIYMPDIERVSHYFYADLQSQFDSILHFDVTRAVEPLERNPEWKSPVWEAFPPWG